MPEVTQQQKGASSSAMSVRAKIGASTVTTQVWLLIKGMRPRQWTKNILVFAGITFAGRLLDGVSLVRALVAFAVFCLLAGATYLINDLADLEQDRVHPIKRYRPLASGRLAKRTVYSGIAASLLLALTGIALIIALPLPASHNIYHLALTLWPPHATFMIDNHVLPGDTYTAFGGSGALFAFLAVAYFALMLAYTFRLKHIVLLDVFAIAAGFVLRAMAGAVAVAVHISPWLYLCTILLSLFLALGKRRQELLSLEHNASAHRRILSEYTPQLLDQLITVVTSATIMAYSLYTFQGETGDRRLMVTIPFVLYGIFRYLYLVYARGEGGSPEEILLRDAHVRWSVVLCAITVALVLYVLPS
ncbi:MAG TPA: decaprenyl-phosphate phosphoribosyltransferase [Ktedonobacterales bacterium]